MLTEFWGLGSEATFVTGHCTTTITSNKPLWAKVNGRFLAHLLNLVIITLMPVAEKGASNPYPAYQNCGIVRPFCLLNYRNTVIVVTWHQSACDGLHMTAVAEIKREGNDRQ